MLSFIAQNLQYLYFNSSNFALAVFLGFHKYVENLLHLLNIVICILPYLYFNPVGHINVKLPGTWIMQL